MSKNITIAGASYSNVPAINVPITGGGSATYYDCVGSQTITENGTVIVRGLDSVVVDVPTGGNAFVFGGQDPVLLDETIVTYGLDDTSFIIGSSTSTAATTIRSAETAAYEKQFLFRTQDLYFTQELIITPTYGGSPTNKARQLGYSAMNMHCVGAVRTNPTTYTTATITKTNLNIASQYRLHYFSSNSSQALIASNYGFYGALANVAVSDVTEGSDYYTKFTCSSPSLSYRCSSTYQSTANMKLVTSCEFKWIVRVWGLHRHTSFLGAMLKQILENVGVEEN